jgi:hypothetical protein
MGIWVISAYKAQCDECGEWFGEDFSAQIWEKIGDLLDYLDANGWSYDPTTYPPMVLCDTCELNRRYPDEEE